jgi:hypothetical protein
MHQTEKVMHHASREERSRSTEVAQKAQNRAEMAGKTLALVLPYSNQLVMTSYIY